MRHVRRERRRPRADRPVQLQRLESILLRRPARPGRRGHDVLTRRSACSAAGPGTTCGSRGGEAARMLSCDLASPGEPSVGFCCIIPLARMRRYAFTSCSSSSSSRRHRAARRRARRARVRIYVSGTRRVVIVTPHQDIGTTNLRTRVRGLAPRPVRKTGPSHVPHARRGDERHRAHVADRTARCATRTRDKLPPPKQGERLDRLVWGCGDTVFDRDLKPIVCFSR